MGIALDVWVNIDEDCTIEREVSHSEVQIDLGHSTGSLHIVATEQALANLVEEAGAALRDMRSGDLTGQANTVRAPRTVDWTPSPTEIQDQ
jgi:hypothetical protein